MNNPTTTNGGEVLLQMRGIKKSFGAYTMKNIDFRLRAGTVHAICGENGAGKSTLMKIISGVYQADKGEILLKGKPLIVKNPVTALDAGISMIYQELDLAEHLTVYENLFLGRELHSKFCKFKLDNAEMKRQTDALIAEYGFNLRADALISELSVGEAQIVEILKAIHRNADVIIMDEPTSALSAAETERLFGIIGQLKTRGIGVIYISHRLDEVMRLADEVSVLRDGEVVMNKPIAEVTVTELILRMVGREISDFYPKREPKIGEVIFSARGLDDGAKIHNVSFDVRAGEIVGMAGLVGAGRTETAEAIFGVSGLVAGEISLNGKKLAINSPADALKEHIAYLTEDRKRTGLCVELPCCWNITLPNFDVIGMPVLLNLAKEMNVATRYADELQVKWGGAMDSTDSLSGGNQQKLLFARWIMAESQFLILDEPTRGIDIAAKKEIYSVLNELAARGKAILLISSELPEILGMCDRVLVMNHGEIVANLPNESLTQEAVMKYAAT